MIVETFLAAAVEQGMDVRGPVAVDAAATEAVERALAHAGDRAVAVPVADPLLEELGVREALRAAGARLLAADDPSWRAAIGAAGVGVTGAQAAVAATATLLLPCGPGRPRGTHVVPAAHVCLLRASDLVPTLDEAMALLVESPLPSNVSWVSGPSRTADLEMHTTIGVHGPRAVTAVVVDA